MVRTAKVFTSVKRREYWVIDQKNTAKNITAKTPNTNAPYKHSDQTGNTIDYEGIEIIDRADSNIKETLHIIESKPDLNTLCKNEFDLKTYYKGKKFSVCILIFNCLKFFVR